MKMKKLFALLMAMIMIFSLTACGSSSSSDSTDETDSEEVETIKIGLMVSLSGSGVQAGEECQALAEIFEDIINNVHEDLSLPFADTEGLPNLGNAKVEFVIGDISSTEVAQSEAERLITEEGVIGLCGNFSSATTKTAMVAAEKYGVILLSEGTSATLTDAGYTYYGRSFPGDDVFIEDTFDYLDYLNEYEDAGITTICLVSEDSEFGTNIAQVEAEVAEAHGYTIVENISYSATATNLTSEVLKIKEADADVVLCSSYASDSLLLMSTFKEQNYFPNMLFGQRGGFMASDFIDNLGSDSDYVFTTSRWNSDMDNDAAQQIAELFYEATGYTLLGDTLASVWDGVLIAIMANQAGSTDGDAMREVMSEGLDLDVSLDPFALEGYVYGDDGQNIYGSSIIVQYYGEELYTVYPLESATFEAIYPALSWDER